MIPLVSNDFETCLIRPGLQSPPPVCYSWADEDSGGHIVATAELGAEFRRLITLAADGRITLVGHNFAYDTAVALAWIDDVTEPLFAAYERGAIVDTMIYERIAEIGKYTSRKNLGLDVVGAAYGIQVTKDPVIRLGYGALYGEPLSVYLPAQREYPIADACNTLELIQRQIKRHGKNVHLADVAMLCRKQFWLQLTRNWGMRTDPKKLSQLRAECKKHVDELRALAQKTTIDLPALKASKRAGIKVGDTERHPLLRDDGTRDMRAIKAYVLRAYDGAPPITATGEKRMNDDDWTEEQCVAAGYISTAAVTLQESGDFMLEKFAEFGEWSSVENKDLPMLEKGMVWPIHTKYGIADTTRMTSAKPNMSNFRRKEGIRECVVPRAGCAFISVDHGGLELCTVAQVIVNVLCTHDMADKINSGIDLHCNVAQYLTGWTYEETHARKEESAVKNFRQVGKVVNFGRFGYMGAETLVHYAKHSYHVDLSEVAPASFTGDPDERALAFAKSLIVLWGKALPEGPQYLAYAKRLQEGTGGRELVIPGCTIKRRGISLAAAANTGFQGLGAVLEAYVGWQIARCIYLKIGALGRSGARLCNFVHDEFILEVPLAWVTEVAAQLEEIMANAPKRYLPDVRISSEAIAMLRWSKNAKRIVDNGELIPWDEKLPAAA